MDKAKFNKEIYEIFASKFDQELFAESEIEIMVGDLMDANGLSYDALYDQMVEGVSKGISAEDQINVLKNIMQGK